MNKYPYVIGTILNLQVVEIPNKARNKPSKKQARIELSILEAYDNRGEMTAPSDYSYPDFAGDPSLIEQYEVGDKVKIVCTTATGRHIKSIEKLDK